MKQDMTYATAFTGGLLSKKSLVRLALGLCPTLAVTTTAFAGLVIGVAVLCVLVLSSVLASLLRKILPESVRLLSYFVIVAGLATVVHLLVQAYLPEINTALGIYLPIIAVNCLILNRVDTFAAKQNVLMSGLDSLGTGISFVAISVLMGVSRELLGLGAVFGYQLTADKVPPITAMQLPFGGFLMLGVFIALAAFIDNKVNHKKPRHIEAVEEEVGEE